MRLLLSLTLLGLFSSVSAQDRQADEAHLRTLHAQLLQAHVDGDVELWMVIEADSFVSINGGQVSFPTADDRRARRMAYLDDTAFTVYRDLREPLVRISEDGSLGWLIAEVEIAGTRSDDAGGRTAFHDVWAWIELYERADAGWRMVGNASNRK